MRNHPACRTREGEGGAARGLPRATSGKYASLRAGSRAQPCRRRWTSSPSEPPGPIWRSSASFGGRLAAPWRPPWRLASGHSGQLPSERQAGGSDPHTMWKRCACVCLARSPTRYSGWAGSIGGTC